MSSSTTPPSRRTFILLTLALALLSILLNARPLFSGRPLDGHEVFVAQAAREIVRTGEWVIPRFNDRPRLKKPPLMYWAVAAVEITLPGAATVPPWTARLPSVLAGAALVALTAALGAVLYDRRTGLLAALLALTSLGFFDGVNSARPEMLYAACCALLTLGLAGAWSSRDRSRPQTLWSLAAWSGFALACLAKGPHLPILIAAGFALAMALTHERRRILPVLRPLTGLLITLLAAGAWVAAVLVRHPDALAIWNDELIGNSAADTSRLIDHLSLYYLHAIPTLVLPWVIPLILGLFVTFERARPDLRRGRVLFWAIVLTAVVMTIPDHRRGYYMIPILPALAVLMSRGTIDAVEKLAPDHRWHAPIRTAAALTAAAAVILLTIIVLREPDRTIIAAAITSAILCIASLVAIIRAPIRAPTLITAAALPWLVLPAASDSPALWRSRRYSLWSFYVEAAARMAPTDAVYSIGGLETPIVYILDRPVPELRSLRELPVPAPGERFWVITEPDEIAKLPPALDVETVDRMEPGGSASDERLVLLSITAAHAPSTPIPEQPANPG